MKVQILYDNRALPGYRADWGFACTIEGEQRVMFDTGADASVLTHNMKRAGVDPTSIDLLILSHRHWDHTGGLPHFDDTAPGLRVLALPTFADDVKEASPALVVECVDSCDEVAPGIFTTGPVYVEGQEIEQAIGVRTDGGIMLITGCAHPGVDALMTALTPRGRIRGVLGGFHGFDRFDALTDLAILGACHCTQHRREIARRFPESYRDVMAGTVLDL